MRKSFTCEPGNTLIVADYGQLELRVLAHMVRRWLPNPILTPILTLSSEQVCQHDHCL